MEGYQLLHNKIMDWEWYRDSKMVHLFIHGLVRANWGNAVWRGIAIERGQFVTSLRHLSEETGISYKTIRLCVKRLKRTGEWAVESTNKYSIVTILNWDKYQYGGQATGQSEGRQRATDNKNKNKNKNKKENTEIKKPRVPSVAGFPGGTSPETEAPKTPSVKADPSPMFELLQWAIGRRDGAFPNKGKQFAAMKRMKQAGIGPNAIKERWEELEGKKFYQDNGLDFASVAASFDRKR